MGLRVVRCDGCRMGADGPVLRFSETWQLVINTGTTIVTFLMVFLIQSTLRQFPLPLVTLQPMIEHQRDDRPC